jgi:predicted RNA-binding Zn-ribbon protein involved in translation (DUF1610 family)
MGCFDSFFYKCPKCGARVEWQTKSGPCTLMRNTVDNYDPRVVGPLHGQAEPCPKCGVELTVLVVCSVKVVVGRRNVEGYDEDAEVEQTCACGKDYTAPASERLCPACKAEYIRTFGGWP